MPITAPGSRQFYYWIKWDKDREPKLFVAKNWIDLNDLLNKEIQMKGDLPEWMIRDYTKA